NPAWSSLAASSTVYLYVNASTGVTGSTTVLPIYQTGGTPAVTSGQFTFNISQMIGYMGNGSAAPATPLVFVGEVVTSGSAVTSTVAYAYNGMYDSGWATPLPAAATPVSKNSNLGLTTTRGDVYVQCLTAENGYSIGDQILNPAT